MKFRVHTIDASGRPRTEVIRADSEEEAREILLGEALHPKRLEPVDESEKVTFVSRKRVEEQLEQRRAATGTEASPPPLEMVRTVVTRDGIRTPGDIGFAGSTLHFTPDPGGDCDPLQITSEDVETARISGFPARTLQVFLLNGELLEFSAGVLAARPVLKRIATEFARKP